MILISYISEEIIFMRNLKCPVCGAELDIDKDSGIGVCNSCGTKVQTYDKVELERKKIIIEKNITNTIIDQAKIKEVDNKEKARIDERNDMIKLRKPKIIFGTLLLVIGIVCFILCIALGGMDTSQGVKPVGYLILPAIGGIIAGIIVLCTLKSKKQK